MLQKEKQEVEKFLKFPQKASTNDLFITISILHRQDEFIQYESCYRAFPSQNPTSLRREFQTDEKMFGFDPKIINFPQFDQSLKKQVQKHFSFSREKFTENFSNDTNQ